ncbi:hypothetical protein [Lactobacillus helveticus]|uniref:hypothetical protein n=1 Tax=Lactobacillus helveticus TaxID=1587 RepID=UPI001566768C|nr:hypothetical protein [Lactobacillus helveticus]NRO36610.1 hypothetical protein [Lactobacillus helveticus]
MKQSKDKEITINDAIIGLKQLDDPVFGSISYRNPCTTVIIRTHDRVIKTTLEQIRIAVFKFNAETFGFIFQNGLYHSDYTEFDEWNAKTKRLASHELKANF